MREVLEWISIWLMQQSLISADARQGIATMRINEVLREVVDRDMLQREIAQRWGEESHYSHREGIFLCKTFGELARSIAGA